MTDIVERLLLKKTLETVEDVHVLFADAADEIERLRATLDQTRRFALSGEMDTIVSDEIERLREALREIAKTDVQTWARAALEKGDWAIVERIAEVDQQGIACRALAEVGARTALREKE